MVTLTLSITACASHPDKLAASSISPVQYQDYNCKQLGAEVARVNTKMVNLYHSLDKKADNDSAQMAIGMILFWPTLFFLEGGDGVEAAEYSRLKGELDALETVSIRKSCGIDFPIAPVPVKKAQSSEQNYRHD